MCHTNITMFIKIYVYYVCLQDIIMIFLVGLYRALWKSMSQKDKEHSINRFRPATYKILRSFRAFIQKRLRPQTSGTFTCMHALDDSARLQADIPAVGSYYLTVAVWKLTWWNATSEEKLIWRKTVKNNKWVKRKLEKVCKWARGGFRVALYCFLCVEAANEQTPTYSCVYYPRIVLITNSAHVNWTSCLHAEWILFCLL